jgi:predicted TPR repeat methyltransferase
MMTNTPCSKEIEVAEGKDYYDQNYADYDRQNTPGKLRFYKTLVQKYVASGRPLFELGIGCGNFLGAVGNEYQCAGCDINTYGLRQAERYVSKSRLYEGSTEVLAGIRPRPHVIVAWDVLEHIPQLGKALNDIRLNLADDGYLMAVVPVYDGPLGHITRWLDNDPTHYTKEGRNFWITAFRQAGFSVVEWGGIIRRLVNKRCYLHLTGPQWLLRHCCTAIYVIAAVKR